MTERRTPHILFAEDDASLRRVAEYNLSRAGYNVSLAVDGADAWKQCRAIEPDLVITDLAMPKMDGFELLKRVRSQYPDTEVVIITAHGTVDRAVEAMKVGAFDFITKPFEFDVLRLTAERALERQHLRQENIRLHGELADRYKPDNMVGVSAAMRRVFEMVARVAPTNSNVLVLGESGTGKELVAKAIHHASPRAEAPFVAVNCGALPNNLVESELFGVQRGAFTGADTDRPGRFERAAGGTLFLDEITELPAEMQVKLLRALQERQIERLGATVPVDVDVRFICATNADIDQLIADGRFRQDLYYRINVVTIQIPPLRDHPDDIEPLVHHFLTRLQATEVKLAPGVLDALRTYTWPGNVRELENVIERTLVLRKHPDRITIHDLPTDVAEAHSSMGAHDGVPVQIPDNGINFYELEKSLLKQALRQAHGNQSQAARLLGLTRQTLLYRLRKFGIE
ncbi:MAG: sigma-54 dependent transcriptional regulator [Candidatus Zixiibacteriota bacterium]